MDKIRALRYFKRVAELKSFTRVAEEFSVPSSSISRRIKDLEEGLGIELLQRSTRVVNLTELGAVYYSMISEGLSVLDDADELVSQTMEAPSGIIRISAMPSYGEQVLSPVLETFHQKYPEIILDLNYTDDLIVLGKDPVDISIRGGFAPDERVIAKRISNNQFRLVASPVFLKNAQLDMPLSVETLKHSQTIQYRGPKGLIHWYVKKNERWEKLEIKPVLISNNGVTLVNAALKHKGFVFMPQWGIQSFLDTGELVEVQVDESVSVAHTRDIGIFLLYLRSKYQIPKIKLCVDFLLDQLTAKS